MRKKSARSYVHVTIQFTALFYILFSGPILIDNILIIPELVGFLLGIWAIVVMRKSYLTIFPEPDSSFTLIEKGPYKVIRHPMYLALFLVIIPVILEYPTKLRIFTGIVFSINQIIKLFYEEKMIKKQIDGYAQYMHKTWRIIPFLF